MLLVSLGCDVNCRGGMPIVCAAAAGALDLVKWLIANGADLRKRHIDRNCVHVYRDRARQLRADDYRYGLDLYDCGPRALVVAAKNGWVDVVKELRGLCEGDDGFDKYGSAMTYACMEGHVDVVREMKSWDGADSDKCFYAACFFGHIEIINMFVDEVSRHECLNVMWFACREAILTLLARRDDLVRYDFVELVKLMDRRGMLLDFIGVTGVDLCYLVGLVRMEVVEKLIREGVHVSAQMKLLSCRRDEMSLIVQMLVNELSRDPAYLIEACLGGAQRNVEVLLQAGARCDIRMVEQCDIDIVRLVELYGQMR